MRAVFFVLMAVAACRSQATPTVPQPAVPPPTAPAGAPLARALAGPYADLAAFCATQPSNPDDLGCEVVTYPKTDGAPKPPLRELALLYVPSDAEGLRSCAIALRTERGWFVSARSNEICHDRSHLGPTKIDVSTDGDVTIVQVELDQHTNHAETLAQYTLAAFCGARDGAPACSPWLTTRCEAEDHASICGGARVEATWQIDGDTITLNALPPDAPVRNGTHRLF